MRQMAARIARGIHAAIPPAAAEFIRQQRFVVLSAADRVDRAWVSALGAEAGFARAIDERRVALDAVPPPGDPLHGSLAAGSGVGLLFIDFAARRRMRLNGVVESAHDAGFTVAADQVYSNCPKYIQRRESLAGEPFRPPAPARRAGDLTSDQRRRIAEADTFFIGTTHRKGGWDASHRGGLPGLVRVGGPALLSWPDYAGNTMFNTLGNILADGRAGLLFPDFSSGGALLLSGTARLEWGGDGADAERRVVFTVEQVVERSSGVLPPMRLVEYSPFNPLRIPPTEPPKEA